jgi:hypothetical protein
VKRAAFLIALVLGLSLALAHDVSPVAAEPVFVDLEVQTADRLTVGDRFFYVVTLDVEAGTQVSVSPDGLPPFLALAGPPQVSTESEAGGRARLRLSLALAAFAPGELPLPPVRLAYTEPSGETGVIETISTALVVQSVLPAGEVTPRDLKPQAEIATDGASLLLPVTGAVLLAVILLALAVRWLRTRRRPPVSAPVAAPAEATLEDLARAELDRAGIEFAAGGDYVPYYLTLALTVRGYLSQRFGFPAFALTTRELQDAMVRSGVDRWQARLASGLLSQCDAVVYASYRPARERADADLTAAYEIVEMSRIEEREEVAVS